MTSKEFCSKWLPMLEKVETNESLKEKCRVYSAFVPSKQDNEVSSEIKFHMFLEEAYDSGIVVTNYGEIVQNFNEEIVSEPTDDFIAGLSEQGIIGCIAWHFRRDHFSEGSLINESIANGSLLKYFKALIGKNNRCYID